jgi:hypothetical protein
VHRVLEKLRFGDALPIVQQHFRFGFSRSRILLSEKSMRSQMQNVRRMDLEQRFFGSLFGGEVGPRPTQRANFFDQFISFFLRTLQAPKAPILDFRREGMFWPKNLLPDPERCVSCC